MTVQPPSYALKPPQGRPFNGFGLASLIIGALSLLFAFVPFANYASGFFALVGVVLGIVGLVLKGRSKVLAAIGTAVSALALILSITLAIVYTAGFFSTMSNSIEEVESLQSAAANTDIPVVYEITGDAASVDVSYSTYSTASSGTEQADGQALPLEMEFTVATRSDLDSASFFLTGMTGQAGGSIMCRITVDGHVVSETTSSGPFSVVACSSSALDRVDD